MKSQIQFVQIPDRASAAQREIPPALRHSAFAWLGLRPFLAQHTLAEHEALQKYARNARSVVEIGVAEGASAAGIREVMPPDSTLYLVDPFHLSRVAALNFCRRAAHRAVASFGSARTVWLQTFSHQAAKGWNNAPIDFLLIDGDHREEAVERDWLDWSPFVTESGVVAFHDARVFASGWPTEDYGPVQFVNRFFRRNDPAPWAIVDEVDSLVFVSRRKPAA